MLPIIIIGSGLAGYMLAKEFRKLNQTTPLQIITQDDGTYYSKPQLSSAFTHHKTAGALATASAAKMAEQLDANILTHTRAIKIDPLKHLLYTEQAVFPYSALVLAQGAEVIPAPLKGNALECIVSVNNLEDYVKFRSLIENKKRLAILGAGLVGCEFTNDLLNAGFAIDVIALAATPLDILLPPELGITFQDAFAAKGVRWHLNRSIQSVDDCNNELILTLSDGSKIATDRVLSAIGLRPVLQLAKTAQLSTRRGIIVDANLRTSATDIYALGDCAEVSGYVLFYVAPLIISARALAQTLNGQLTAVSYPPMPVILKTPACPVVVNPPPLGITGRWQITGNDPDKKAQFYDEHDKLQGFALTGKAVLEKLTLVKELPNLL